MYHDLQRNFWWNRMKGDITEFVQKCQVCEQVKVEHMRMLVPVPIPEWKWEHITMNFVIGIP